MRSVYKNASLNIAASGATNSSVGLSFERKPLAFRPFCVTLNSARWVCPPDWPAFAIQTSPLNRRAWVLQERVLSTRIIHFTVAGLRWECRCHLASDLYPFPSKIRPTTDNSQKFKEAFAGPVLSERAPIDMLNKSKYKFYYERWLGILCRYAGCDITKSEDKLIAIQGIAETIKEVIGVELVCGMWKEFLIHELLWQVLRRSSIADPPRPLQWRAPSWSWANSDFPLILHSYPSVHLQCPEYEEVARIIDLEVNALPSGQISNASLTLKGRPMQTKIAVEDFSNYYKSLATLTCKDAVQTRVQDLGFDRLPLSPYADELTFVALIRCHCPYFIRDDPSRGTSEAMPTIGGLMLRRHPNIPPTYSRIGVLRLTGQEACDFYTRNQSAEEEELALV